MKAVRKGFTLVELLIVIAILGTLSAAMTVSSGSANAAAKASTIYTNINTIKTAAILYQLQEGNQFKETNVTKDNLKTAELLDLDSYNKTGTGESAVKNSIMYEIVAGVAATESDAAKGAYVICSFKNDSDFKAIAKSLKGYRDIRINGNEENEEDYTVGAFLFHNTPADGTDTENYSYNREFEFTESNI